MSLAKTRIQRGKEMENFIADQIISKGIDDKACRSIGSGSGNREKADISTSMMILGRNAGIEAKNHKALHIPEWWKQTLKLEQVHKEPVLVFKLPRTALQDSLAVVKLNTILELIKYQKNQDEVDSIIAGSNYEKRNLLFKVRDAKSTMAKLISYLKD